MVARNPLLFLYGRCNTWRYPYGRHDTWRHLRLLCAAGVPLLKYFYYFGRQAWYFWPMAGSDDSLGIYLVTRNCAVFLKDILDIQWYFFFLKGVLLLTHGCHFPRQAWYFGHAAGSGDDFGSVWLPAKPPHICVAVIALDEIHLRFVGWYMAAVLGGKLEFLANDWVWWRAWVCLVARNAATLAWQEPGWVWWPAWLCLIIHKVAISVWNNKKLIILILFPEKGTLIIDFSLISNWRNDIGPYLFLMYEMNVMLNNNIF